MVQIFVLLVGMFQDYLLIPQRTASATTYGISNEKMFSRVGGRQNDMPLAAVKGTRYFQSGNFLIIADKSLSVYREKQLVYRDESLAPRYFYEYDGDKLVCGFFDRERIVVEKYNHDRRRVKMDVVESNQRHILYSGGKMSSFIKDGILYVWVPSHDLFLSYDAQLTNLEVTEVPLPRNVKNFDGSTFERFDGIAEKGSRKQKTDYLHANRGDLLRVEPVAMIDMANEPVFTYNVLETGARLIGGDEIEVKSYTLFITLDGKVVKRELGGQFAGLSGEKFLVKVWDERKDHHVYKEISK